MGMPEALASAAFGRRTAGSGIGPLMSELLPVPIPLPAAAAGGGACALSLFPLENRREASGPAFKKNERQDEHRRAGSPRLYRGRRYRCFQDLLRF
jgi:hypothetical protein